MIGLCRGEPPLGAASFFRRIITSAEARCQVNRGINATTSTKMKELLRFIPFFAEFYCLFFLGGHKGRICVFFVQQGGYYCGILYRK